MSPTPSATTALPVPLAEADPLQAFFAEVEPLQWQHPRRLGLAMIQLGMATTLAMLPISVAMMHVGFWVAMAGTLLARPPIHRLPGFWIGVAFAGWQAWSVVATVLLGYHPDPMRHWGALYSWLALYFAIVAFRSPRFRRWAVGFLLAAFTLTVAVAAVQFCVGFNQDKPPWRIDRAGEHFIRASGLMGGRMPLGVLASLLLVVMVYGRKMIFHHRLPAWLGRSLALAALALSGARAAWAGCIAGVSSGAVATGRRRWLYGILAVATLTGAALLAEFAFTPWRMKDLREGNDGRISIWEVTVQMVGEHPVIGFGGREAFQAAYIPRYDQLFAGKTVIVPVSAAGHAHNSILALAVEHGIPAAILYLAWLTVVALSVYRIRHANPDQLRLVIGLVATWLVAGLFENIADQSGCAYAGYLLLGLALGSSEGATRPVKEID